MIRLVALSLLVVGLGSWYPAQANEHCVPGNGVAMSNASDAPWTVQIRLQPGEVPLNSPLKAEVTVCSLSELMPERITVDATMPAHKHGMNYVTSTEKIADGHYQVENLLFHMPGVWRLEVTAYESDKPHRFTHDVTVQ